MTDIVDSTALTEHLGDAKARELLRDHERAVREALAAHGGSEIKTMGDGFMASFGSATRALECAVAIQRAFAPNAFAGADADVGAGLVSSTEGADMHDAKPAPTDVAARQPIPAIRVRIGLNAGEPVAEDGDLFGSAVNLAARIAAEARGGEILVSDVVRQLVAGKGFAFTDRGDAQLKGFEEPVRMHEAKWREQP